MIIGIDVRPLLGGNISGVEVYTTGLIKALATHYSEHTYVLYSNSAKAHQSPAKRVIDSSIKANFQYIHTRYPNKIFNILLSIFRWPHIDSIIKKKIGLQLDAFIVPDLRPVATSKKCKLIMTVHDLAFHHFPHYFSAKTKLWYRLMNPRKQLKKSDHITTVSSATKKDLIASYHLPAQKISIIPPGLPTLFTRLATEDTVNGVREKHDLPEKFFLFLGTHEPRKNMAKLLEAFELFKKENPESTIHLVVAGKANPRIFRKDKLQTPHPDIHFIGFIEEQDKPALYSAAIALIYPSLFEGFGLPLLEAMSQKTPIITSNTSSMPEVAGEAAIYCDPQDNEALAAAMERICQPKIQQQLQQASEKQLQKFSWEKSAHKLLSLL